MLSLTCEQVRQSPHGALQLCDSSWVPPHILGVPLITTAHSVEMLLKVRHFRFKSLHIEEINSSFSRCVHDKPANSGSCLIKVQ